MVTLLIGKYFTTIINLITHCNNGVFISLNMSADWIGKRIYKPSLLVVIKGSLFYVPRMFTMLKR